MIILMIIILVAWYSIENKIDKLNNSISNIEKEITDIKNILNKETVKRIEVCPELKQMDNT